MGLEFGPLNPRAATQITMEVPEISGALNDTFKDKNVAVESMWEFATAFRGDWENREGWGWHNLEDWDLFLTTIRDIGQLTQDIAAEDIIFNDYVAAVNEFDHEQVMNDAESFVLSAEFEAAYDPKAEATPTP